MLVKDFNFYLPQELIARYPATERDASRLMVLNRENRTVGNDLFGNLNHYLKPGDLLVMNDTKVIPARIFGVKPTGGRVEIFLVRRHGDKGEKWECLLRASKRFREGQEILLSTRMKAVIVGRSEAETVLLEFVGDDPFEQWLEREGHMPLPPYLQRDDDEIDRERYQTVVARVPGAIAAPTAGLHFTRGLIDELASRQIKTTYLTLHTGLGTFQPVRVDNVEEHRIHTERYNLPQETVNEIEATRERGGRVVAVGTTTARTLEYTALTTGKPVAGEGEADIFIYPGFSFKVVDALITNFHLPESTLLMLVAAFAGREYILDAYGKAVSEKFRFYSYGDAMLIA